MVIIIGCSGAASSKTFAEPQYSRSSSGSSSSSGSVQRANSDTDLCFAITTDELVTKIMDKTFEHNNFPKLSQHKMTRQVMHYYDGTEYVRKSYGIGSGENITFFESKETGLIQRIIMTSNKATDIGNKESECLAANIAVMMFFEGDQSYESIYSVLNKESDGLVRRARGKFLSVCEILDDTYSVWDYQPVAK